MSPKRRLNSGAREAAGSQGAERGCAHGEPVDAEGGLFTLEVFDDTDESHFRSSGNRSQSSPKGEVRLRGEWRRC